MLSEEELARRFGSTATSPAETADDHVQLRALFLRLAKTLNKHLPDNWAKEIALKELEGSAMWAHKALAHKDPLVDPEKVKFLKNAYDDQKMVRTDSAFLITDPAVVQKLKGFQDHLDSIGPARQFTIQVDPDLGVLIGKRETSELEPGIENES